MNEYLSYIVYLGDLTSGDPQTIRNEFDSEGPAEDVRVEVQLYNATLRDANVPGTITIEMESGLQTPPIVVSFTGATLQRSPFQTFTLSADTTIQSIVCTGFATGLINISIQHRRAQIVNALAALFQPLTEHPWQYPLYLKTIQKRYIHWTQINRQSAIPAMLLNYDEKLTKRDGGANAEFASLGETEEYLPIAVDVILEESTEFPKPLTDQVSDAIYTVQKFINGTPDLDVEGVYRTNIAEVVTSAGQIAALAGTPFEVVRFRVVVTHVYRSNNSV